MTLLPPVILEYKLQAFHAKGNYHYILYQYGYCGKSCKEAHHCYYKGGNNYFGYISPCAQIKDRQNCQAHKMKSSYYQKHYYPSFRISFLFSCLSNQTFLMFRSPPVLLKNLQDL